MPSIDATRYGLRAWLFVVNAPDALARCAQTAETLHAAAPDWLCDAVPAFSKLLVEFRPGHADAARAHVEALLQSSEVAAVSPRCHEIPVRYDGPDLDDVARHADLSVDEVIRLHSAPRYGVAMLGFSPGFPYLEGLDEKLHTPRRADPRTRIDAGSVAIGGPHTGIYSLPTPGGWNVIGRTDVCLFNPAGEGTDAFLLRPGDSVQFLPIP